MNKLYQLRQPEFVGSQGLDGTVKSSPPWGGQRSKWTFYEAASFKLKLPAASCGESPYAR